jgi:hypothetical protein
VLLNNVRQIVNSIVCVTFEWEEEKSEGIERIHKGSWDWSQKPRSIFSIAIRINEGSWRQKIKKFENTELKIWSRRWGRRRGTIKWSAFWDEIWRRELNHEFSLRFRNLSIWNVAIGIVRNRGSIWSVRSNRQFHKRK